jgi:hypothetical protein
MTEPHGDIESCSAAVKTLCKILHLERRLLQAYRPTDVPGRGSSAFPGDFKDAETCPY